MLSFKYSLFKDLIENVGILFQKDNCSLFEKLKIIHIQPIPLLSDLTNDSILGLDVLSRYTIKFENDFVVLER